MSFYEFADYLDLIIILLQMDFSPSLVHGGGLKEVGEIEGEASPRKRPGLSSQER